MTEADFDVWHDTHQCEKNYDGSAGVMEPFEMKQRFPRSIDKYALKYTGYLGDGDSELQ